MSGPSSPDLGRLSIGITPEDIEEDARAKTLRHVSGRDVEASGSRPTHYEHYNSPEPSDGPGYDIGEGVK